MATNVFVDTNIVIDLIENRDYERESVHTIFKMAEQEDLQIFVSETVITNSLYITGLAEQLTRLLKIVKLCCFKKAVFQTALTGKIKDKEDAILYFGALENDMDYFITRNVKDFKSFQQNKLPVLTARQFVNKIS